MDNVFKAANGMCGRGPEFLEWPYLDNATSLLKVLSAHAHHPSATDAFVDSEISFCSPLSLCNGGVNTLPGTQIKGLLIFCAQGVAFPC